MAKETRKALNNMTIYQVYVRNHGPNGTFADVQADLDRIQALNVDVVYFMPIHPIGQLNKKGSLGCPYSIKDYRAVNPEYGTEEDFRALVADIHKRGMKVMIDVVYNHTAHDAVYIDEHPDWYHVDENGKPFTTVPRLERHHRPQTPQRGTVAIPDRFPDLLGGAGGRWLPLRCGFTAARLPSGAARSEACALVKRDTMWLTESVHMNFVRERRRDGLFALSDSELYQAFDMAYDYDIWPIWDRRGARERAGEALSGNAAIAGQYLPRKLHQNALRREP